MLDRDDDEIGHVEELFIDQDEGRVRFLEVGAGGFLGLGERKFLIPVDAITRIHDNHVHVDQARAHVAGAPDYDPETIPQDEYISNLYNYYGYTPFWAAGYAYPGYPFYV